MRLQGSLWLLLPVLSACACAGSLPAEALPALPTGLHAQVEDVLPPDRRALQVHRGDLDGDGDGDAVIVTTASPARDDDPRGVILAVHRDGGWRVAARNDRAIPCARCGGALGDPLAGISFVRGGFVLRLEGGSRELWSVSYRFRHDAARARWMLDAVDRRVLDRATGAAKQAHAGEGELKRLDLSEFDPGDEALAPIP